MPCIFNSNKMEIKRPIYLAKLKNYYSYTDTVTIISQGYHNQRAITMAAKMGLPAIAYSAEVSPSLFYKIKNYCREALARVKMVFSLYIRPIPDYNSFNSNDKKEFEDFLNNHFYIQPQ